MANYRPLGRAVCDLSFFDTGTKPRELRLSCGASGDSCCDDPCQVLRGWGWGNSELHYALILSTLARRVIHPAFGAHIVIDTSRNGYNIADCRAWCNVRNAALGAPPTNRTLLPGLQALPVTQRS